MKSKIATGIVLFSVLVALSLGVVFAENNTTVVKEDVNATNNLAPNNTSNLTPNATNATPVEMAPIENNTTKAA